MKRRCQTSTTVAVCQAQRRAIDFRLTPDEALAHVDKNLVELERIVERAAERKCNALGEGETAPAQLIEQGNPDSLETMRTCTGGMP